MAYTYLDVTNEVLSRFNEVELTSANFTGSRGFQTQCKNAVNSAIRHINQKEYAWPFNHNEAEITLVANTTRYALPTSTKLVDYDTFRLVPDATKGATGRKLAFIDYKEYIQKYSVQEDTSGVGGKPTHVFRDPANKYGLYPYPDNTYKIKFDYYVFPADLGSHNDTPTIPERFRHVVADGAVMYGYQFRGEIQQYQISLQRFEEGINNMLSVLGNRHDYVRSTYIPRSNRFSLASSTVT